MRKKYFIILSAGIILSLHVGLSHCAEQVGLMPVPIFTDVKVRAHTAVDSTGLYTYSYTITNPAINTGKIWSIDIDIIQPANSVTLSSEGLTIVRGSDVEAFDEIVADAIQPAPMVPIGIQVPGGWDGHIGAKGFAGFSSGDPLTKGSDFIFPDETQSGFELISRGLPTIRLMTIEPWWVFLVEDHDAITDEEEQRAREVEDSLPFHTSTLGPTAPPLDFKPLNFLDYIISLKHEAVRLGWIKNEGIINSLDKKLENAKKAIERGSIGSAKNVLNAFINEVEAQGCEKYDGCPPGKHLTPEGYGLLKYNVEYLLDRL